MKIATSPIALTELISRLSECLTPESARRVLALKADRKLQARVDDLALRQNKGKLTQEEQAEYGEYVRYSTFIAILKSKARQMLTNAHGDR